MSVLRLLPLLAVAALATAQAAPPAVSLLSPAEPAYWLNQTKMYAAANASDADGQVARVEFYVDDQLVGTTSVPAYYGPTYFEAWLSPRPAQGEHQLTAVAYDNEGESAVSAPRTLTVTAPPDPPDAETWEATWVTSTSARLNGAVNPHGGVLQQNDYWFEYGLTEQYTNDTKGTNGMGDFGGVEEFYPVFGGLSFLQRNTTYHYRLVVQNEWGIGYGEDRTFTTPENLLPVINYATGIVKDHEPTTVYIDLYDPDYLDQVTIESWGQPSHGTLVRGELGNFIYTPDETFEGIDSFDLTVSDDYGAKVSGKAWLFDVRKASGGQYVLTLTTESGEFRTAGFVVVNVTRTGSLSGAMNLFGARYPFAGRFDDDGNFVTRMPQSNGKPYTLSLSEWGGSLYGLRLSGWVTGPQEFSVNPGNRLDFPENAPQAGSYTMVLPTVMESQPLGNGYVVGGVSRHGRVVFTGRIGDGQAFSFGTQLRAGGAADLAIQAGAAPRDRLHGTIQFPGAGDDVARGELYWVRAPRATGYFQGGFKTLVQMSGSRLTLTDEEDQILDYSTELAGVDLHFDDLNGAPLLDASFSGPSESALSLEGTSVAVTSPALSETTRTAMRAVAKPATLRVNRRTGVFTGQVRVPTENGRVRNFSGVLLQHQNKGSGLLMFGGRAGKVTITPR